MPSDNTTPHGASEYDVSVRQTIPFYDALQQEVLEWVAVLRPDVTRWLDTGCGTGHLIERALVQFPQAHFVLADPSEAMLAEARERLAGESRVRLLPPTSSASLNRHAAELRPQVITAVLCHHYQSAEDRRASVEACYEALAPGGVFIVVENSAPCSEAGTAAALARWGRFQRSQGRSADTVSHHLSRYGSAYFPITVDEHLALLRAAGFRTVECFWHACIQAGFYAIKPGRG